MKTLVSGIITKTITIKNDTQETCYINYRAIDFYDFMSYEFASDEKVTFYATKKERDEVLRRWKEDLKQYVNNGDMSYDMERDAYKSTRNLAKKPENTENEAPKTIENAPEKPENTENDTQEPTEIAAEKFIDDETGAYEFRMKGVTVLKVARNDWHN